MYPLSEAKYILDLGCGPGQIISQIIKDYGSKLPRSVRIMAADVSPNMIRQVQLRRALEVERDAHSMWGTVDDVVCDAQDLSAMSDDSFSHITAGLVLFLLPKPQKALTECLRVLNSEHGGGVLAATCWPHSDWQDLMKLLVQVCPDKPAYEVPREWQTVDSVRNELEEAGFREVTVNQTEVYVGYDDPAQVYHWLIRGIPYLIRHTADLGPVQLEDLKRIMIRHLNRLYGSDGGRMVGTVIVTSGKK